MKSKDEKRKYFDLVAPQRDFWRQKNRYYYEDLESFLSFLIPPDNTVLEIGCGTGELLAGLRPSRGLGIDFSAEMIRLATDKFPSTKNPFLEFRVDDAEDLHIREKFDYVIMSDLIGELTDIWKAFRSLKAVAAPESRIVITTFNHLWEPILQIGELLKMKMPQDYQNWLGPKDIDNLLRLNGFEVIRKGCRLIFPKKVPLFSAFLNRFAGRLPLVNRLGLVEYLIARPLPAVQTKREYSVTVVAPCRNERGNIRQTVLQIPDMGSHTEILFVDGNSTDGTVAAIEEVIEEFKEKKDIRLLHQVPPGTADGMTHGKMLKLGKGDAVRKGFAAASGNILMILDSDLTVHPEELPKFYLALVEGFGEFINGTRLVYPMEKEAMRLLNKLGNKFFSLLFTWLLDQQIKDTLCGTKVLFKKDYEKIVSQRSFFGNFDPFGDFDLLFGAAKQNLKIVEVPVHYRGRTYGSVKIQRFKHGLLLFKMSFIAMIKLKLR
jgi:ubiquinone/menaquinone biosynthesis C-methylase UbiE/glycosyltransferase involved in cell wall biosynthesis